MDQFPPNSMKSKSTNAPDSDRVERVTSSPAVRRRTPLGKQFKQTFFGGDARSAGEYMVSQVLIPMIKDAFLESLHSGLDRLFMGESRGGRRRMPMGGPLGMGQMGHMQYNRMYQQQDDRSLPPTNLTRQARARHDFGEIILATRQEAEEVIDRLYDLVSQHDQARIADLYELTGIQSSHVDFQWGWTNLDGASVGRVRGGGYLLNLPQPVPVR